MARRYDDTDDDSFDENGVLKDGHVARVRMTMHDGGDNLTDLQRSILSDAAIKDAFATRDATARSFGLSDGLALSRPGFRHNTSDTADTNREKLYDGYERGMGQRWRGASDNEGQAEGAQCTCKGPDFPESFGSPGHMQMLNGKMVCVPDDLSDYDSRSDSRSNSRRDDSGSNNESHQSRMEKLYAARDADLSQAWRSRS